jgi:glycosyltransferase involved in cell wall biosynthesis
MLSPNVSIVLPTYNGAEYLRQSIESCRNQSYRNIELIIVDDASTETQSYL